MKKRFDYLHKRFSTSQKCKKVEMSFDGGSDNCGAYKNYSEIKKSFCSNKNLVIIFFVKRYRGTGLKNESAEIDLKLKIQFNIQSS